MAELRGVDVPRETTAPGGDKIAPTPVDEPESLLDKAKGVGEAGLTLATGAAGVVPAAAAGAGSAVTGGLQAGLDRFREFSHNTTYQPRGQAGQRYIGNVAQAIDDSKLAGMNPAVGIEAAALSRPAMTAARQTAGKIPAAVAASPEGEMMSRAASGAKLAVTPMIEPDRAALARKAQLLGIELRPDMLSDNKFARMIGEVLDKVPLSGAKTEQRQTAFNRALMNTIGADEKATRLTPDVFDKAFTKAGSTIGDIYGRANVPLDKLQPALTKHLANTEKETADVTKIVSSYVDDLHKASENGVIPGKALRKINSQIGEQVRGTQNGDLRRALHGLQDDMLEALSGQISPQELAALNDARKKYAISVKLIPLVAKSPRGDISPAGLMQAITSDKTGKRAMARGQGGDVGELAKIGQLFLKEPASSGTAERTAAFGLLGGGAALEPMTATGIYGAANLYNRAGPAITRKLTGVKQTDIDRAKLGYQP